MMEKMTAVEWLITEINKLTGLSIQMDEPIIEQALEMEQDQIRFFFKKGHLYSGCPHGLNEIYNKTYNNEQRK